MCQSTIIMTKVSLVFPPTFVFPSYAPPLGIAYLRSYLQSVLPATNVETIDSNLVFLNALIEKPEITISLIKKFCMVSNALPPDVVLMLKSKTEFPTLFRMFTESPFFSDDWVYQKSLSTLSRYMARLLEYASLLFKNAAATSCPLEHAAELLSLLGLRSLVDRRYDIVGFSVLYSVQIPVSFLAARAIRQILPNTLIVLGGAAVSQMPSNSYEAFIYKNSPFDCLCIGEGEIPLLSLVKRSSFGKNIQLQDIPNLVSRSSTGKIIRTIALPSHKVETQPFPCFDGFDLTRYHNPYPVFPILSSRGCSWHKCRFCDYNRNYLHSYRQRTVEHIVDEMEMRLKSIPSSSKSGFFAFEDSEIPPVRAERIAREIIRRKIKVKYFFLARPIKGFTSSVISLLRKSGCRLICFGVESFNQRILDLENKGTCCEDILKVIGRTKREGVKTYCLYFSGFPSQTIRDIAVEIDTIFNHHESMDLLASTTFTLFRNAEIINFENLIAPDFTKDKPLYQLAGKPVFSRAVPFVMKKGMSKEESETAMSIIRAVFLCLKGRQQLSVRSEYHTLMKSKNVCLDVVRRKFPIMPELSVYKRRIPRLVEEQKAMLKEIYPDNMFRRMFASAAVDVRNIFEAGIFQTDRK